MLCQWPAQVSRLFQVQNPAKNPSRVLQGPIVCPIMPLPYMSNTMTRFGPQSNTSLPKRLPISDPSQYSPTHLSPIQRSPHSPSRVDPYLHIQRSLNRLDTSLHSQYSPTQVTPPTQSPANSPLWAEDVLDIRQSKDIYRFSQATTISMFSTDVPSTILNAIIDPTPSTTSIAEPMSPALSSSESGQSQVGSSVCDSYYIFRQASFNSMILCMPPSANESRPPLYRITVSMNCFNPTSHITTVTSVRRSGMEVEVGSFEYVHQVETSIHHHLLTFHPHQDGHLTRPKHSPIPW